MNKELHRFLVQTRTFRGKIRLWQGKLRNRAEHYRNLSAVNATRFSAIAQQYAKESEQLEKISQHLERMDVILEMLEMKVETALYIDYIAQELVNVVEALREFKKETPFLGAELTMLLDELYTSFYTSFKVPEPVIIQAREKAVEVLQEADQLIRAREKEGKSSIKT
jgi:hypothetical protein